MNKQKLKWFGEAVVSALLIVALLVVMVAGIIALIKYTPWYIGVGIGALGIFCVIVREMYSQIRKDAEKIQNQSEDEKK